MSGAIGRPELYLERHPDQVEPASRLTAAQLADIIETSPEVTLVDLRNPGECALGG